MGWAGAQCTPSLEQLSSASGTSAQAPLLRWPESLMSCCSVRQESWCFIETLCGKNKRVAVATNQAGGVVFAEGHQPGPGVVFAEGQRPKVEACKTSPCSARISCAATVQLIFLALAVLFVLDLTECSRERDRVPQAQWDGNVPATPGTYVSEIGAGWPTDGSLYSAGTSHCNIAAFKAGLGPGEGYYYDAGYAGGWCRSIPAGNVQAVKNAYAAGRWTGSGCSSCGTYSPC